MYESMVPHLAVRHQNYQIFELQTRQTWHTAC